MFYKLKHRESLPQPTRQRLARNFLKARQRLSGRQLRLRFLDSAGPHGTMPNADPDAGQPITLSPAEEKAYRDHDLRNVAWYFLSEIRHNSDFLKYSAPAASMMRVILAQGDEPQDRATAIAETAVIGSILHGIAPRDAAQWAIAEQLYDEATLQDFRHWTPVLGYFGHAPREDSAEFCSCGCRWRQRGGTERGPTKTEPQRNEGPA